MKHLFIISLLLYGTLFGAQMRIATYNVENLFDLKRSGNEYVEYIPNTSWRWNAQTMRKKLENIARVIGDMNPDIIALEEIESLGALKALRNRLKQNRHYYPYYAIANQKNTTVKVALLSRFPILYKKELRVTSSWKYRNILEAKIDIHGEPPYLFVNHWKSKSGPESMRIVSAKVLKKRLEQLGYDKNIVIVGDFNSHYEEYKTFKKSRKHNDTHGKTGINHILKTVKNDKPVRRGDMLTCKDCLYSLWYEIEPQKRWSHKFRHYKEALDNILISKTLLDDRGLEYKKGSFKRFAPKYLTYHDKPYRWQQSRSYPKHHTAKGYSDHYPIYADFTYTSR